jgi:LCP family protein required for cell wall assembly
MTNTNKQPLESLNKLKKYKIWKWLIAIGIGLPLLFVFNFFLFIFLILKLEVVDIFFNLFPQSQLQGVNILVFGIDDTPQSKRSDTIMVVHLDKKNKRIGIMSIPRDTYVAIEGHGKTRINHAYSFGKEPLLQQTVSDFLGIPIDYYIKIDLSDIATLIDEIGGLDIDVDHNLHYTDKAGDLFIDIDKGKQRLNGDKAMQYLRFRHDEGGDMSRIQRQQEFVAALSSKLVSVNSAFKTPTVIKLANKVIESNLETTEMITLFLYFKEAYKLERVEKATIPGAPNRIGGASYWIPDLIALEKLVGTVLGSSSELTEANINSKKRSANFEVEQTAQTKQNRKNEKPEIIRYITSYGKMTTEELLPPDEYSIKENNKKRRKKNKVSKNDVTEESITVKVLDSNKSDKTLTVTANYSQLNNDEIKMKEENRGKTSSSEIQLVAETQELALQALDKKLKIELLNGIGTGGIANKAASILRDLSLSVKRIENADKFDYNATQIIAWKGNIDMALALATVFEINPNNIVIYDTPDKTIDITIVLGKDWLAKETLLNRIKDYVKKSTR